MLAACVSLSRRVIEKIIHLNYLDGNQPIYLMSAKLRLRYCSRSVSRFICLLTFPDPHSRTQPQYPVGSTSLSLAPWPVKCSLVTFHNPWKLVVTAGQGSQMTGIWLLHLDPELQQPNKMGVKVFFLLQQLKAHNSTTWRLSQSLIYTAGEAKRRSRVKEPFNFQTPNILPSCVLSDAVSGCVVVETVNSGR